MNVSVTALWRYPIKSHGRERLARFDLVEGGTVPFDRHWAVTHAQSKFDPAKPEWVMCRNFMIGSQNPRLAALSARLDEAEGRVTLTDAELGDFTFRPDDPGEAAGFLDWIRPFAADPDRVATGIARLGTRGITDTDFPSVSIMNEATHRAVSQKFGRPLERERWRGNIWLEGLAPWEEFDLIGRRIRIGEAVIEIAEPVGRCKHTMANPVTGRRDADTLAVLREGWDHQDFGVYGVVVEGGAVREGDRAEPA